MTEKLSKEEMLNLSDLVRKWNTDTIDPHAECFIGNIGDSKTLFVLSQLSEQHKDEYILYLKDKEGYIFGYAERNGRIKTLYEKLSEDYKKSPEYKRNQEIAIETERFLSDQIKVIW